MPSKPSPPPPQFDDICAAVPPLPGGLRWIVGNPSRAAVVVFVVLIVYQAALPSGLTLDPAARTITWNVLPSDSFHISKADVIGNVVPYMIFGHFVFLASWRRWRSRERAVLVTLVGTIAIACTAEGVEWFNLERGTAVWDVISGAIGAVLALMSASVYIEWISGPLYRWVRGEITRNPLLVAGAMLALAVCWDAARPFYVISSGGDLLRNIKYSNVIPFEPPGRDIREQLGLDGFSPAAHDQRPEYTLDYFGSVAERFLIDIALFALLVAGRWAGEGWRQGLRLYAATILLAELIGLGVVYGGVDVTHIAIAVLAAPVAWYGSIICAGRPRLGLGLLLGLFLVHIVVSDLRPYCFGPREVLSVDHFVPLISHVRSTDVMLLANIVEAVAVYAPVGMLLYLLLFPPHAIFGRWHWPSLIWPCVVCGALGLVTEIVQLWIPARTSGVEDAIYAALGGYVGASAARLFYYYTATRQLTERPDSLNG